MSSKKIAGLAMAAMGLVAGSVLGAGNAQAANLHGAMAWSDQDWAYAVSVNHPTREAAEAQAMQYCDQSDCEIWASWANGCMALVTGEGGDVAYGVGANRAEAERLAYEHLAELQPQAMLANFGSAQLSGARVIDTVCTDNAG